MKINCVNCGHSFSLDSSYQNFEGPCKCPTCRQLLLVKTENGQVRSISIPGMTFGAPASTAPPAPAPEPVVDPRNTSANDAA